MTIQITEICLGLFRCVRTETFVVLERPTTQGTLRILPCHKLGNGKERFHDTTFRGFHDGSDEHFDETVQMKQRGIVPMKKIHDQTLDVRSIEILICHDHDRTVSKCLERFLVVLHRT